MSRSKNPYPDSLVGGSGRKSSQVIKSVIKTQSGMVLVFDDNGEQIPEYQDQDERLRHVSGKTLHRVQYLVMPLITRLD